MSRALQRIPAAFIAISMSLSAKRRMCLSGGRFCLCQAIYR